MSNLKRDIEKMIERVAFQAISDYGSKGETPTSDNELIKEATTQIINLIESVADEIIGKDDRDYSGDNADEESLKILVATSTACNELRKEQRDIKSKLIGKE